jgi:flavin-dependent dehydrogenase
MSDTENRRTDFDVIIVGGRPAGSTLAARLGQLGLKVLLLERAKMPSLPGASCPIIYASTMALLDEIGADEATYAHNTPKIHRLINITAEMRADIRIPMAHGRDYAYAIDRERFDAALWTHALSFPTVEGRDGYSVLDLIWDGVRVVGIVGQKADGEHERITADLVVGADGRFSTVARKVNAKQRDQHLEFPTTLYYAYWKGVPPFDDVGAAAVAYGEGEGYGFLMMDSADDTIALAVEGQSEILEPAAGQADAFYMELLRKHPFLWRRVENAVRITDVRGMKRIGNLYREPGGMGWALVGDAYHQKDPIDGQGIFDAVYTAKLLASAIADWKAGRLRWGEALVRYDRTARAETYPMYRATIERVRNSLYPRTPKWFNDLSGRTWLRWLFEDPLWQQQLGLMLTRQIAPDEVMSGPIFVGALLRGPLRDLSRFLEKQINDEPLRD